MCKGLGLDLCGISRMEALLRDERFLNRYFTPAETAYVHATGAGAAQTLAGLYAAKEAVLKAMGIVLMTQFAAQVCRDMDAPSIACRAELCGRLMLLGVALPIFLKLTQMAVGALQ